MPHGSDGFFAKEPCCASEKRSGIPKILRSAASPEAKLAFPLSHFSWKNSISSPTGPWQNAMRAGNGGTEPMTMSLGWVNTS